MKDAPPTLDTSQAPASPVSLQSPRPIRIGVVLSAGGLRGVAHLGVMRRLIASGVPIDVIVGASVGAIVASYYAAVGLSLDDLIADATAFKGRHLLMHAMTLRAPAPIKPLLRRLSGAIPRRLAELEDARFDRLYHGVKSIGIVCHDLVAKQPAYFSTNHHYGVPFAAIVKSSAAVPGLFAARPLTCNGHVVQLSDGGLSDSLPFEFAGAKGLGATHLVVSDCRRIAGEAPSGPNLAYIRPALNGAASFRSPAAGMGESIRCGEQACTRARAGDHQRLDRSIAHRGGLRQTAAIYWTDGARRARRRRLGVAG